MLERERSANGSKQAELERVTELQRLAETTRTAEHGRALERERMEAARQVRTPPHKSPHTIVTLCRSVADRPYHHHQPTRLWR